MIFFTVMYFINQPAFQMIEAGFCLKSPDFLALLMLAVAVFFSFLHLGKKSNAVNSLNHLSSSWLSREIFAVLLFGSSVLLAFLLRMLNPQAEWAIPASLIFSSLTGIFLVTAISKVYLIKTIPPWNSWHTPMSFFLSALSLGAVTLILISLIHFENPETNPAFTKFTACISWIAVALIAIEIIATLVFHSALTKQSPAGIEQISFTSGTYHTLKLVRIFILFVALVFIVYFIIQLPGSSDIFHTYLRFFSMIFALVIIEEIIGRYLFYASYYRVGV
jgi:DMSO reductase anchor subunit